MTKLDNVNKYGEELEQRLRLRTSPIAAKFIKNEKETPDGAIRPKRDLGYHLALCQAFFLARHQREMIAMFKEDHWCSHPVMAFGLAEPPQFYLEGNLYYPYSIANKEAAARLAQKFLRVEKGKYEGIVVAPLPTTPFEPDMVVIYCDSAQLRGLLSGVRYKEGHHITTELDPGGACMQATISVLLSGDYDVAIPCAGDRKSAATSDDELIFSFPWSRSEDLMLGLRHADEVGLGYNSVYPQIMPENPLPDIQLDLRKMLGLDVPES